MVVSTSTDVLSRRPEILFIPLHVAQAALEALEVGDLEPAMQILIDASESAVMRRAE